MIRETSLVKFSEAYAKKALKSTGESDPAMSERARRTTKGTPKAVAGLGDTAGFHLHGQGGEGFLHPGDPLGVVHELVPGGDGPLMELVPLEGPLRPLLFDESLLAEPHQPRLSRGESPEGAPGAGPAGSRRPSHRCRAGKPWC
jgi:hypothetical protein